MCMEHRAWCRWETSWVISKCYGNLLVLKSNGERERFRNLLSLMMRIYSMRIPSTAPLSDTELWVHHTEEPQLTHSTGLPVEPNPANSLHSISIQWVSTHVIFKALKSADRFQSDQFPLNSRIDSKIYWQLEHEINICHMENNVALSLKDSQKPFSYSWRFIENSSLSEKKSSSIGGFHLCDAEGSLKQKILMTQKKLLLQLVLVSRWCKFVSDLEMRKEIWKRRKNQKSVERSSRFKKSNHSEVCYRQTSSIVP